MSAWMALANSATMEPFPVVKFRSSVRSRRPIAARTLPFTVLACTGPPVLMASTPPFTGRARTWLGTPSTDTFPSSVPTPPFTPFGPRISNRTPALLLRCASLCCWPGPATSGATIRAVCAGVIELVIVVSLPVTPTRDVTAEGLGDNARRAPPDSEGQPLCSCRADPVRPHGQRDRKVTPDAPAERGDAQLRANVRWKSESDPPRMRIELVAAAL